MYTSSGYNVVPSLYYYTRFLGRFYADFPENLFLFTKQNAEVVGCW